MTLGVFGDSFADSKEQPFPGITLSCWQILLSKKLNMNLENYAYSGTSLWYSYKKFLENYKDKTHIAFIYTEYNRWPSLPEELKRFSSIYSQEKLDMFPTIKQDKHNYDIMQQLVKVHPYIFDEQYNMFVYQQIFNSINQICRENNIKLINIFPFCNENPNIDITNTHGSCITGLVEISYSEIRENGYGSKCRHDRLEFFEINGDYRANHLNSANNMLLSDVIFEEINNNTNRIVKLFNDTRVEYDSNLLLKYIDELEAVL